MRRLTLHTMHTYICREQENFYLISKWIVILVERLNCPSVITYFNPWFCSLWKYWCHNSSREQ